MSDLDKYKEKINQVEDSSLDSTARTLALLKETEEMGNNTLTELNDQGEKLNRVEGNLDTINADMKKADKTLTNMEKWFGLFTCPWNRSAQTGQDDSVWDKKGGEKSGGGSGGPPSESAHAQSGGSYVQTITGSDREKEMEENLGQIGKGLGNMKNIAMTMNQEITRQNDQIDVIQAKTVNADAKLQANTNRTNELMK